LLVVAGRILTLGTAFGDDRCPDPEGLLAFLDVPIKVVPPRVVACDLRYFGTLERDEERISVRIVVEVTLDVEPLLELLTCSCIVDVSTRSSIHS